MAARVLPLLLAAFFVINTAFAANAKAPTVADILRTEDVQAALTSAWDDSFLQDSDSYQVRGGWIYADSNYPDNHKYLLVQHASKDRSTQPTVQTVLKDSQNADIQLDNPEKDGVPSSENYKLVADFHTHPFPVRQLQTANTDEVKRAYDKGVPGILVSCSGVFFYGPERRDSLDGPAGYPEKSNEGYNGQTDQKFGDNKFDVHGHCKS